MAGKYEVYKDKSGGFRFRLKAANGEVIASSQSYKTKASAMGGVESVKKNAASAVVDLTEAAAETG
ncbi:YegP family protein [Arthrobacter sp. NPDC058130]|uniref:YegP family protein n=1 Tax=Arthrobacter sp. NPDC058130 TaxID=3346353 RepID=UPI0036E59150